jgi:hypothetical protein
MESCFVGVVRLRPDSRIVERIEIMFSLILKPQDLASRSARGTAPISECEAPGRPRTSCLLVSPLTSSPSIAWGASLRASPFSPSCQAATLSLRPHLSLFLCTCASPIQDRHARLDLYYSFAGLHVTPS